MKTELYLGLDVDKEWIVIAVAEWGRNGAVQESPPAQGVSVATWVSLPGKKRLSRSPASEAGVFARTGAAASSDEGDPGGVSHLGATGQ
jgi:hypothetical protein